MGQGSLFVSSQGQLSPNFLGREGSEAAGPASVAFGEEELGSLVYLPREAGWRPQNTMTKGASQQSWGALGSRSPPSCLRRAGSPGRGSGSSSGAPGDTCGGQGTEGQAAGRRPSGLLEFGREGPAFQAEKLGLDSAINGKSQEAFFVSFLHFFFFFNPAGALGKCLNRTKKRQGEG